MELEGQCLFLWSRTFVAAPHEQMSRFRVVWLVKLWNLQAATKRILGLIFNKSTITTKDETSPGSWWSGMWVKRPGRRHQGKDHGPAHLQDVGSGESSYSARATRPWGLAGPNFAFYKLDIRGEREDLWAPLLQACSPDKSHYGSSQLQEKSRKESGKERWTHQKKHSHDVVDHWTPNFPTGGACSAGLSRVGPGDYFQKHPSRSWCSPTFWKANLWEMVAAGGAAGSSTPSVGRMAISMTQCRDRVPLGWELDEAKTSMCMVLR